MMVVSQVMMRLFSPRKTTLMFVIRDKTRVSFFSSSLRHAVSLELDTVNS